jgi:CrcB protein
VNDRRAVAPVSSWTLAVAAWSGGMLGSALRGAVQMVFANVGWTAWGAHVAINVAGAALIGVLFARLSTRDARGVPLGVPHGSRVREHLLGAGFLGGFTTVSGFAWDVADLLRGGAGAEASMVLVANSVVGIAACAAGYRLAIRVVPPARDPEGLR